MGWEERHGRLYLFRNRRVNGRPRKEYLAAADPFGFGDLQAELLDRVRKREARVRELRRKARAKLRDRVAGLFTLLDTANADLRIVVEGTLSSFRFHRHHRGEWRMRRELKGLASLIGQLKANATKPEPLIDYRAPADDAEAVAVFAKARAGDPAAREQVHDLVATRKWVDWLGDLGRQATQQLVHRAAGGDPVWKAGIVEKVNALRDELLGDSPTVLDHLLVRRVVNGWVATHALELELTIRPPADPGSRADLDRALSRAQKRFTDAVRELARVRRLRLPVVLAHVNVVGTPAPSQLPGES